LEQGREALVQKFLKEFKAIATRGGIYVVHRQKNQESLVKLGLTKRNCIDEILGLSLSDYCRGPEPDTDRPGEIWEFGKVILGKEVYIKLKIADTGKGKIAKCISFHLAEFPICFPFKIELPGGKGGES